eukprot:10078-Eustigmatos_ZCMA.PRE.1
MVGKALSTTADCLPSDHVCLLLGASPHEYLTQSHVDAQHCIINVRPLRCLRESHFSEPGLPSMPGTR